jgi:hypothetical protein
MDPLFQILLLLLHWRADHCVASPGIPASVKCSHLDVLIDQGLNTRLGQSQESYFGAEMTLGISIRLK